VGGWVCYKWEDLNTNYNMVHVDMRKNKKKNEEDDAQVVTLQRVKDKSRL
jgi:hypothetical protein